VYCADFDHDADLGGSFTFLNNKADADIDTTDWNHATFDFDGGSVAINVNDNGVVEGPLSFGAGSKASLTVGPQAPTPGWQLRLDDVKCELQQ
jgi:hypothetical protein